MFFFRLIQTSEEFNLKTQIVNFLFQLLIELSVNFTHLKHFQLAVMDLVYLLLIKGEKEEIGFQQIKLPKNVQNLFLIIDLINGLNDQIKQKSIPELFFNQLENPGKLNFETFNKSNQYFDRIIDQQLIDFINTNLSFEHSYQNFIENLSTSPTDDKYPLLSNIPIDSIQIRCEFFYRLNIFITKVLPMIDLNLSTGQSFLTDEVRKVKIYLFHQTKLELLSESIEKTTMKSNSESINVSFDTIKANDNKENGKHSMFYQAYQQLYSKAHIHFRKNSRQIWQSIYVGMHSIDQGGPYRDSITQICADICSTRLPLFILSPNGRMNIGLNRDCWIPNVFPPNKSISDDFKQQYQFIGQLMGLAIRKKHYLDLKFPLLVWKELLNESITIEDIESIDIQAFTSINEIEKNLEQTLTNKTTDMNLLFSSIINELHFEVVSSASQTYELIPGGINIPITSENFKQYVSCYRQYRLNEFQRQIQFIRQGLCSVVPFYYLNFFTPKELEEAVCGKGQIDIELLKRNTQYAEDDMEESPHIERFWTVMKEMFDEEQKKLFLTFVWGRNTLPRRDEDFLTKFTINPYDVDENDVDKVLPRKYISFKKK